MRIPRTKLLVLIVLVSYLACSPLAAFASETAAASSGSSWASWYGAPFHGRVMANGEIYNMWNPTTTASNWFPFNTWVRVTNPANGRSVTVRVTDRGHFDWAVDLSYAAFAKIASPSAGKIRITYQVVSGPTVVARTPTSTPKPVVKTPTPTKQATTPRAQPSSRGGTRTSGEARPAVTGFQTYVVRSGDTLSAIARLFGVDLRLLIDTNRLSNPNLIYPQQEILIPGPQSEVVATYAGVLQTMGAWNGTSERDVFATSTLLGSGYVYPARLGQVP